MDKVKRGRAEAVKNHKADADQVEAVLQTLSELRKRGVVQHRYRLASPYSRRALHVVSPEHSD